MSSRIGKRRKRIYSDTSREALRLFGMRICLARRERRLTTQEVADRAGISRVTLLKIEQGHPATAIGPVFEVATILGVALFDPDPKVRKAHKKGWAAQLALLPTRIRTPHKAPDNS